MTRKYSSWGKFLKENRELHFRSAREFCLKSSLGISYPQYSRYEAGFQLPTLELALRLFQHLNIPLMIGLLEWSRAQVDEAGPRAEIEKSLEELKKKGGEKGGVEMAAESAPARPSVQFPLNDVVVFNRSHLRLFASDPLYRDIFIYINSFAPEWVNMNDAASSLGVPVEKLVIMARSLHDLGVVDLEGDRARTSKMNFYFPDDEEFFELRNSNLKYNVSKILDQIGYDDLTQHKAYRGMLTVALNDAEVEELMRAFDDVKRRVTEFTGRKTSNRVYSICLVMGERFPLRKTVDLPEPAPAKEPRPMPGLVTSHLPGEKSVLEGYSE